MLEPDAWPENGKRTATLSLCLMKTLRVRHDVLELPVPEKTHAHREKQVVSQTRHLRCARAHLLLSHCMRLAQAPAPSSQPDSRAEQGRQEKQRDKLRTSMPPVPSPSQRRQGLASLGAVAGPGGVEGGLGQACRGAQRRAEAQRPAETSRRQQTRTPLLTKKISFRLKLSRGSGGGAFMQCNAMRGRRTHGEPTLTRSRMSGSVRDVVPTSLRVGIAVVRHGESDTMSRE